MSSNEPNTMTEDQMNPDICPSSLGEDGTLDRTKWDGAHVWYEGECSECGATRSDKTLTISISSDEDVSDVLARVKELIEQGYTSGFYPTWNLTDDE